MRGWLTLSSGTPAHLLPVSSGPYFLPLDWICATSCNPLDVFEKRTDHIRHISDIIKKKKIPKNFFFVNYLLLAFFSFFLLGDLSLAWSLSSLCIIISVHTYGSKIKLVGMVVVVVLVVGIVVVVVLAPIVAVLVPVVVRRRACCPGGRLPAVAAGGNAIGSPPPVVRRRICSRSRAALISCPWMGYMPRPAIRLTCLKKALSILLFI